MVLRFTLLPVHGQTSEQFSPNIHVPPHTHTNTNRVSTAPTSHQPHQGRQVSVVTAAQQQQHLTDTHTPQHPHAHQRPADCQAQCSRPVVRPPSLTSHTPYRATAGRRNRRAVGGGDSSAALQTQHPASLCNNWATAINLIPCTTKSKTHSPHAVWASFGPWPRGQGLHVCTAICCGRDCTTSPPRCCCCWCVLVLVPFMADMCPGGHLMQA